VQGFEYQNRIFVKDIYKTMKKTLFSLLIWFCVTGLSAQENAPFKCYLYNDTYQVYMKLNLYDSNITVPNQDIFGELPGYFGAKRDTRLWLVTDAEILSKNKARLSVVNDFGSEDFEADLIYEGDGKYTYRHKEGSVWKIVVNGKYVKIPKEIELVAKEE